MHIMRVLPYSSKNDGESEDTHSQYWGEDPDEYQHYQTHGDPKDDELIGNQSYDLEKQDAIEATEPIIDPRTEASRLYLYSMF